MSILKDLKIKAAWFEPDAPDKQIFGTLNEEKLETFQTTSFSESIKSFNSQSELSHIPILYGIGQKTVTLVYVIQTSSESNLTNLKIVTYVYNDVILGIHYKKTDKIKKLSFTYPFVWGPFMSKKLEEVEHGLYYKINKTVNMDNSTKLHIGQNMGTSFSMLEQKTTQSEFFQIETQSEIGLEDIMKYLKSINHFLRLCMGKIIFPKHINGITVDSKSFKYYPYWLIYYLQNKEFKNPRITDDPIIRYFDLRDNFELIMQKWICLWFKTDEIMYDFFNIFESNMSLNTMFTEQSHVLQRFYDAFETTKKDFRNKIKWFLDFCPNEIKTDIIKNNFIDKIVNTRNYNVHGNDVNEKYVVKSGKELRYLMDDLKTLTEIFLVSQLPIINKIPIMEKIYKMNNYARTHPIE